MSDQVNTDKLAAMLKAKRAKRGLRAVANEIGGVSVSTLSRVERGSLPDLDTFVRLCRWLGVSSEEFLWARPDKRPTTTPEAIEACLLSDPALTPRAAGALARLIAEAYELLKIA